MNLAISLHWIRPINLYFSPLFLKGMSKSLLRKLYGIEQLGDIPLTDKEMAFNQEYLKDELE